MFPGERALNSEVRRFVPKSNDEAFAELQWKKFPVLNDGFIALVDRMGDDEDVVQAARVSFNKDKRDGDTTANDTPDTLLDYLMRHRHTTPLEMVEIKLLIRIPMDAWRQMIRHRTANVNEYSTRYTAAIDARQETDPSDWRLQATNNKQGSSGWVEDWPAGWSVQSRTGTDGGEEWWVFASNNDDAEPVLQLPKGDVSDDFATKPPPGVILSATERLNHADSQSLYQLRLTLGVAREQARKDLPLSTYTEAYWKCDLHNVLHFLSLRMDAHAQKEIRDYANIIGNEIVAKLFPQVWAAFKVYRMNAMSLSERDIKAVQMIVTNATSLPMLASDIPEEWWPELWQGKKVCRELNECVVKLTRLGLLY